MKKAIINILFVLASLQVMGVVWFQYFSDGPLISLIIKSTPLTLLFLLGPTLSFAIGFSGHSFGPINSFTIIFLPGIIFLILGIFFFRLNTADVKKKILLPLVLIFTVLFVISGIHELVQKTESAIVKLDRAKFVTDQKNLFEKGIDITYLGVSKFDDKRSFYDSGEEYFIHRFAVSFDALSKKDVEDGSYTLCLRMLSHRGEVNNGGKCLIRTKFDIQPAEKALIFSGPLESDYLFWFSLVESSTEVTADTLVLAVTGAHSSSDREVAELVIYGSDRKIRDSGHVYGGEIVYRETMVGPMTQAGMPTN